MKHLIKKVSASRANIITHFKVGDDTLNVVQRDGCIRGVLNGYEIFSTPHVKEAGTTFGYFLENLLSNLVSNKKPTQVIIFRKSPQSDPEKSYMRKVVPDLKHAVGPKKVCLKRMPVDASEIRETLLPDFKVEKTLNYDCMAHNLKVFGKKTASLCGGLTRVKDDAIMLTRKRLVQSMWGSDKVQKILDDIKDDVHSDERFKKIALYNQVMQKALGRLEYKMKTQKFSSDIEEKRMVSDVLIPTIIENYDNLKGVIGATVGAVTPLVYIDDAFKKHTSYPAKFFLSQELLDALKQDYDGLVRFAVQIPKIEEMVIDPLAFIKLRCLSEMVSS
ncbi:MAG: hypothetical protein GF334_00085 [Candidatus Altiarchaeales archaeon]|nr:hypothetical protein [Candidatus Altiarchaeales archaeon]